MPVWIRRPTEKISHVEVLADLDQLLRQTDGHTPIDRKKGVRAKIERVTDLAASFGASHHTTLFEDLRADDHASFEELENAISRTEVHDLTMTHCRDLGDDADTVAFTVNKALLRLHAILQPDVALCLVAVNRQYTTVVETIAKTRTIIVGFPTLTRLPTIAWLATAACWIDRDACTYQALHASLSPSPAIRAEARKFLKKDFVRAGHAGIIEGINTLFQDRPVRFADGRDLSHWVQVSLAETQLSREHVNWIRESLWAYKLLIKEGDEIIWNEEHSALRP